MKAVALALLLLCGSANAESWISSSIFSYHFDREGNKNERNWGVGIEHDYSERIRIAGGIYRNSNSIDSGYLAAVGCAYRTTSWCAGAVFGGVTGYERYTIVMGGLVLSYERKGWGGNVLFFPKDGGVLGFQIKRQFK